MNVLLFGSGGRESAFAWKIAQSQLLDELYIAPGNPGVMEYGKCVDLKWNNFNHVKDFCLNKYIDMVIVGPEDPLVNGLADYFSNTQALSHIYFIGPKKVGAQLEGSKEFAKEFLWRHGIPTAAYESFTKDTLDKGYAFLESVNSPYVLKADGLAAGKGVLILTDINEAKQELKSMLVDSKFGAASTKVVIEEFLDGIELSCFVLTDGKNYKLLPTAKDYKRIGEGDTGLNTGGMGAISPVPFVDSVLLTKIENRIVKPTVDGLAKDNLPYKGFIFIGLIVVDNEPMVIEYNVRMGDPETEVVLPRLKTDLLEIFQAIDNECLNEIEIEIYPQTAVTVMLVSGGYPEAYEKEKEITGLESVKESIVFHAGATKADGKLVTNGGRVLTVTSLGDDFRSALESSYKSIESIKFEAMNYRTDIGFDL
jgi:phosphoribosylamine--glycine ligase